MGSATDSDPAMEDITTTVGESIRTFLTKNLIVQNLKFPRLRFARLGWVDGYSGDRFAEVGREIGPSKIEVYSYPIGNPARYASSEDGDFFVVDPEVAVAFDLDKHVYVHEACHAIQDWSRWRCSRQDREIDAHFGQALYLVRSGDEKTAILPPRMGYFLDAAREFDADAKYLKSTGFSATLRKLEHEIYIDYQYSAEASDPYFDPEKFSKSFKKRDRQDGKTY